MIDVVTRSYYTQKNKELDDLSGSFGTISLIYRTRARRVTCLEVCKASWQAGQACDAASSLTNGGNFQFEAV